MIQVVLIANSELDRINSGANLIHVCVYTCTCTCTCIYTGRGFESHLRQLIFSLENDCFSVVFIALPSCCVVLPCLSSCHVVAVRTRPDQ